MKLTKQSTIATAMGSLVLGALVSHTPTAEANPFTAVDLASGYEMVAGEGKCGEGKCGEGKCGEDKAKKAKEKMHEGKCGEGKCGSDMAKEKMSDKAKDAKAKMQEKAKEGKCGEQGGIILFGELC